MLIATDPWLSAPWLPGGELVGQMGQVGPCQRSCDDHMPHPEANIRGDGRAGERGRVPSIVCGVVSSQAASDFNRSR